LIQGCGSSNTFASLETEKDGNCYELTDGNNQGVLTSGISSPSGADGIRIEREGGAPCPSDDSRKIGFVVDVFCNEAVNGSNPPPMKMIYSGSELDDIDDSCVYHVQLEHSGGCTTFSFTNLRRLFGAFLMFIGAVLTYLRQKSQKWFM
jgi:hypothetical protein